MSFGIIGWNFITTNISKNWENQKKGTIGMMFVAIGGEPATGKTTLLRSLMKELSKPKAFKFGKLRGQQHKEENLFILGLYDGQGTFEGTDRLSMAVQPDAVKFLQFAKDKGASVLFEGDRLCNLKFLESAKEIYGEQSVEVIILSASERLLEDRHVDREDTQTEKFKKGRKTKYKNIVEGFPCNTILHENSKDTENLVEYIMSLFAR